MKYDSARNQDGASLMEVLVCMVLLGIGMIAGLGMGQAGQIGLESGRRFTTAAGLAQAKMEENVSRNYADLVRGDLEGLEDLDGYIRTWKIIPDSPVAHCVMIRVALEWPGRAGRFHHLQLVTVRSEGVVP